MNSASRSVNHGWGVVLIASAAHFCLFADRALPSALAPALRAQFRLSDTQLGLLIGSAMIVPYAVGTLIAGHLFGRVAPYRVMGWSILFWTAAAAAGAVAGSYSELIAARMAFGFGQAAFAPAALVMLSNASPSRAAFATSVFSTGSASGRSGGLLIGGVLLGLAAGIAMPIAPWRLASLWLLLPNLLLAAVLLRLAGRAGLPVAATSMRVGLRAALRDMKAGRRAYLGHYISSGGAVVIAQAIGAWMPSLVNRRFGLDAAHSAMIVGLIVLLAVPLGHLTAGRLAARDGFLRRGPAAPMIAGASGAFLCCAALVRSSGFAATLVALAGLTALAGFAAATSLIAMPPIVYRANRLAAMSLFLASTTLIGYGIGPLITGMLSDRLGAEADELALALTWVVGVAALVICLSSLWSARAWRAAAARVGAAA